MEHLHSPGMTPEIGLTTNSISKLFDFKVVLVIQSQNPSADIGAGGYDDHFARHTVGHRLADDCVRLNKTHPQVSRPLRFQNQTKKE